MNKFVKWFALIIIVLVAVIPVSFGSAVLFALTKGEPILCVLFFISYIVCNIVVGFGMGNIQSYMEESK